MDNNNFDANKAFLEEDTSDIVYTNETNHFENGTNFNNEEYGYFSDQNYGDAATEGAYGSVMNTDSSMNFDPGYDTGLNYGYAEPNPAFVPYGQPDMSVFHDDTDYGDDTYSFDENKYNRVKNILSFVSLGFLIGAALLFLSRFIVPFIFAIIMEIDPSMAEALSYILLGVNGIIIILMVICWLVSLVTMIVLRVRYSDSIFGLVLMIIHIIIATITVLIFLFSLIMGIIVVGSCVACLSTL